MVAALATVGGGFLVVGAFGGQEKDVGVANAVQQPTDELQDAVDSFLAAARENDCDRAYTFVKQPAQFPGQMEENQFKDQVCDRAPTAEADTTIVEQGEGTATVRVEAEGTRYTYQLERVGDRWKIDPLASSGVE